MENKKVTFMYPYLGRGRASIAIRYTPRLDEAQEVEIAIAYSSPNDQFCSKTGRKMVLGRLESKLRLLLPVPRGASIKDTVGKLLDAMIKNKETPSWTRRPLGMPGRQRKFSDSW